MKIEVLEVFSGELLEEAWQLYRDAFTELNAFTIQRHLMHRHEFDDVAGDLNVQKWVVFNDDGRLCGLATYTNELTSMPLISPAYFERRWPLLYAARKVWYCGFVADDRSSLGVFGMLVERMYAVAADCGGVISLDICQENERLARVVDLMMHRLSGGVCVWEKSDYQGYWTGETNPVGGPGRS